MGDFNIDLLRLMKTGPLMITLNLFTLIHYYLPSINQQE